MRTVIKTIITTVLLSTLLATAGNVEARLKYYRYNDNIPMVEMSLNMMVAMGVLEPIPSRLVHDGNPYHRMVNASYSPYSRRYDNHRYYDYLDGPISPYDDYYDRYSGNRYSGDRYYGSRYGSSYDYPRYRSRGSRWDSPWADRWSYNQWGNQWDGPWGNIGGSPWDYQRGNSWNSPWDSPWGNNSWGNNSWGNQWGSPWNSPWGNQWNNPWSTNWGNQWGNQWGSPWNSYGGSPWGSYWNNQWLNPWSSQLGYPGAWPYTSGNSSLPLSPDTIMGDDWSKYKAYPSEDSSRQHLDKDDYKANKPGYKAEKTSWSGYPSGSSYRRSGYGGGSNRPYRKLNGLWIGENGEMLGIRGNQFLWYDDSNQYSKGQLARSPTMMKARIDGSRTVVRYHYKLHGNELVIMGRDGKLRSFNRMPLLQMTNVSAKPRAAISHYRPERDNVHVTYSSYGPGLKAENTRLYSSKRSDRAGPAADTNRRSGSAAPYKYYSEKRFGMRSTHRPPAASNSRVNKSRINKSGNNILSAAVPTDSNRHLNTGKASIRDSGYRGGEQQWRSMSKPVDKGPALPTTTIPMFQKYLPAAAKPQSSHVADPDELPADIVEVKSSLWNSNTAGLDMNDPNTYLYSYLKDSANTPGSTSSVSTEKSGQADSASTNNDKSHLSANNAGTNIWKPNNQFPDQRQDTAQDWSELSANSEMHTFTWPGSGAWD